MKHLRKYNESVEEKSFEDIRDICQELVDDGFEIEYVKADKEILIRFTKPHFERFLYSKVEETVLRLYDYLGDNILRTNDGNDILDTRSLKTFKATFVHIFCKTDGIRYKGKII